MYTAVSVIEYQPPENERLTITLSSPQSDHYTGWKKLWTPPFRGSSLRVETYARSNAWEARHAKTSHPVKISVNLPFEVVMMILDYAQEPFEHQAVLTHRFEPRDTNPNVPSHYQLGVYKFRNWAEIPIYQLCHESRNTAINRYGVPARDSFPFCLNVDTLTVNIDEPGAFMYGLPLSINKNVTQVDVRTTDGTVSTVDHGVLRWFARFTDSSTGEITRLQSNVADPAMPAPTQVIARMKQYTLNASTVQIDSHAATGYHETCLGSTTYIVHTRRQPKLWWNLINNC